MAGVSGFTAKGVLGQDHTEFIGIFLYLICLKIKWNELQAVGHKEKLDYR
jgi:hypothetical protein